MKKIKKCGFVLIVCLVSVIIVGVYFINYQAQFFVTHQF